MRSGKVRKYATFHWLLGERVSHSNLVCDWLFFYPLRVPSRGSLALWVFAATGQACVSQKLRKPTRKAPENYFSRLKAPGKFGPVRSRHFTPESYGSSHARENAFGKLVGDKMAAAGALFFKVYSVKK